MGGCASRPKDLDNELPRPEPLPRDVPANDTTVDSKEPVAAAEENKGGEQQNEAPLVDLSEPKAEGENASSEPKTEAAAEVVPAPAPVVAEPAGEEEEKKEKAAAAAPAPEEKKAEAEAVAAPTVAAKKPEAKQPEAAVPAEDLKNALLVTA